jgi:hypothetical protein
MGSLFADADEAGPALTRVMWPGDKAISHPEEYRTTYVEVQSPCTEEPYPSGEVKEDEPYLIADPTCGDPSVVEKSLGTEFHLIGRNFIPGNTIEIWWKDPINNEFHHRVGGIPDHKTDENGSFDVSVIMPYRTIPPVAGEGRKPGKSRRANWSAWAALKPARS